MDIFDAKPKIEGYWKGGISAFDYLQGSSREEAASARERLQSWFNHYPASKQTELRARLRARGEIAHSSAVFELGLHELALRGGATGIVIEPAMAGVRTSPDFELTDAQGNKFILEATTATGQSDKERGRERLAEIVVDKLRMATSADFYCSAELSEVTSLEGVKNLEGKVEAFLARLDYDEVATGFEHWKDGPLGPPRAFSTVITRPGFSVELTAIPKGETRGKKDACLAFWNFGGRAHYRDTIQWVRDATSAKAKKYGSMTVPYLIAIDVFDFSLKSRDVIHAVLGSETIKMTMDAKGNVLGSDAVYGRDGSFGTPDAPKFRDVSAVLCVNDFSVWGFDQRRIFIVHNPWAERPLKSTLFAGKHIRFDQAGNPEEQGNDALGPLLE